MFVVKRNNGEEPECDEELSYRIKCPEDDIQYDAKVERQQPDSKEKPAFLGAGR